MRRMKLLLGVVAAVVGGLVLMSRGFYVDGRRSDRWKDSGAT